MRRTRPDWAYEARKSVAHFPVGDPTEEVERSLKASMFIQDICLGVVPISGGGQPPLRVELTAEDVDTRQRLIDLLGHSPHGWHDTLDEAVAGFIEESTSYLAYRGGVWYETVRQRASADRSSRVVLFPLPPGRVTHLGPWIIQHVPVGSRPLVRKPFVILDCRDLWHLALPTILGTPTQHRTLLKSLGYASRLIPDFAMDEMQRLSDTPIFDVTFFRNVTEAACAALTVKWGWPGRGLWLENALEYYLLHRHIRFALAKAHLREHVISRLNHFLSQEEFTGRIVITGIPNSSDLQRLLGDFEAGRVSFKGIADKIIHPRVE